MVQEMAGVTEKLIVPPNPLKLWNTSGTSLNIAVLHLYFSVTNNLVFNHILQGNKLIKRLHIVTSNQVYYGHLKNN